MWRSAKLNEFWGEKKALKQDTLDEESDDDSDKAWRSSRLKELHISTSSQTRARERKI